MSDANAIFELYAEAAKVPKLQHKLQPEMHVQEGKTKRWFLPGHICHRTDGAAVEYANGQKFWFVFGKQYDDVAKWARAALEYEGKDANDANVQDKIQRTMQQDLFN